MPKRPYVLGCVVSPTHPGHPRGFVVSPTAFVVSPTELRGIAHVRFVVSPTPLRGFAHARLLQNLYFITVIGAFTDP